jgi:hypothetical protein
MTEAFPDEDPDDCECGDRFCTGGGGYDPCSQGRTKAEKWEQRTAQVPPLVWGPVIDSRPVGEYEGAEVLAWPAPFPLKPEPALASGHPAHDDIPF